MIEMVLAAHAAQIKSCGHFSSFAQGDFWHGSLATITVQQKPPKVSRHAKHASNMSRTLLDAQLTDANREAVRQISPEVKGARVADTDVEVSGVVDPEVQQASFACTAVE